MTDPYRLRSDQTWDLARDAYLAEEPADSVCDRFDLGLRTFRNRASREGWCRSDQPDPDPVPPMPDPTGNDAPIDLSEP